jgi:ribosomal protein S18 acetylase RimI-like enzyme
VSTARATTALRVPNYADLPEVVRLMSVGWPEPPSADSVARRWTSTGVRLELDARLEDDAYAFVEDLGNGSVWIDVRGRPSVALLDWAEGRAREMSPRVLSGGWSSNGALLRELERRGFELIRHSQRMEIALDVPSVAPVWPEGGEVRTFRTGDEALFHSVQQESFADSWEPVEISLDEWTQQYVGTPRFVSDLWLLAVVEGEPAGVAICHPHPGDAELGWVGELGVLRAFRRRGLGRALLLEAFRRFRERGLRRAALSVDSASPTGANRLYEQAGMRAAARFDIYERPAG